MDKRPIPGSDRPRVEPEIIPPGDPRARSADARMWRSSDSTQRVYVARVGPFGFAMVALLAALLAALVFLLVLGAFVIVIPLAGLLLAAVIVSSMLQRSFRRQR
jgi:Flp pilus assembly protein TadB